MDAVSVGRKKEEAKESNKKCIHVWFGHGTCCRHTSLGCCRSVDEQWRERRKEQCWKSVSFGRMVCAFRCFLPALPRGLSLLQVFSLVTSRPFWQPYQYTLTKINTVDTSILSPAVYILCRLMSAKLLKSNFANSPNNENVVLDISQNVFFWREAGFSNKANSIRWNFKQKNLMKLDIWSLTFSIDLMFDVWYGKLGMSFNQ